MKHRAAIEPTIGHLKAEHRLERKRLKGSQGNAINALLRVAAMNFQKLLGFFLYRLFQFLRSLFVPASRDQFLAVMSYGVFLRAGLVKNPNSEFVVMANP
jgi:hypothetical protein